MYLQKGSVYLDRFKFILLRMWAAGMVVDQWREEIIYTAILTGSRKSSTEPDPDSYSVMTVVQVQSAFSVFSWDVYCHLWLLSVKVFTYEEDISTRNICDYSHKKKIYKKNYV